MDGVHIIDRDTMIVNIVLHRGEAILYDSGTKSTAGGKCSALNKGFCRDNLLGDRCQNTASGRVRMGAKLYPMRLSQEGKSVLYSGVVAMNFLETKDLGKNEAG